MLFPNYLIISYMKKYIWGLFTPNHPLSPPHSCQTPSLQKLSLLLSCHVGLFAVCMRCDPLSLLRVACVSMRGSLENRQPKPWLHHCRVFLLFPQQPVTTYSSSKRCRAFSTHDGMELVPVLDW